MSERKKETFKITKAFEVDGKKEKKEVEFAVLEPQPKDGREAMKVYNRTFNEAMTSGALLRQRVSTYMREQGLWDDEKEAKQEELVKKLNEMDLALNKGGIKLSEARKLALDMRRVRFELRQLIAKRNELDGTTAEGQAENARFNALVARCLVYNETGEPVYKDLDDYLEHSTDDEAFEAASTLASMLYALDKNHEATLTENKFLHKWKFADDKFRLINKDGHLVDVDGRLIDEDGHYVNEKNEKVDIDGNPVDDDGNYKVEASPFLDDDGNPIPDPDAPQAPPQEDEEQSSEEKSSEEEKPSEEKSSDE